MGFPWSWDFALNTSYYVLQFLGQWDEDSVKWVFWFHLKPITMSGLKLLSLQLSGCIPRAAGDQVVRAVKTAPYQLIPGQAVISFHLSSITLPLLQNCSKWQEFANIIKRGKGKTGREKNLEKSGKKKRTWHRIVKNLVFWWILIYLDSILQWMNYSSSHCQNNPSFRSRTQ